MSKDIKKTLAQAELGLELLKTLNNFTPSDADVELTITEKLSVINKIIQKELEKL